MMIVLTRIMPPLSLSPPYGLTLPPSHMMKKNSSQLFELSKLKSPHLLGGGGGGNHVPYLAKIQFYAYIRCLL